MRRAVLLASGGIDSTTCWWLLRSRGWDVQPLFVDFAQPAGDLEWMALAALGIGTGTGITRIAVTKGLYTSFPSFGLLPARNLVLLALASARASEIGARIVAAGFTAEDADRSDASVAFLRDLQPVVAATSPRCRLIAPLALLAKSEVVACAARLGLSLSYTVSCYTAIAGGCGSCRGCLDRRRALASTS